MGAGCGDEHELLLWLPVPVLFVLLPPAECDADWEAEAEGEAMEALHIRWYLK